MIIGRLMRLIAKEKVRGLDSGERPTLELSPQKLEEITCTVGGVVF